MQKIIPNLWFDTQAEEATNFYCGLFDNSGVSYITRYEETGAQVSGMPEGSVLTVEFTLSGQEFIALNGGPVFSFTPSISFYVNCETEGELHKLYENLSRNGFVLMELGEYPFSKKFAWVQDRYGLTWQLSLGGRGQKITPFLMYSGTQLGKAEEAVLFYTGLLKDSSVLHMERYGAGESMPEGTVKHAAFRLNGQEFMAIDSGMEHAFTFTEAVSLMVNCEDQQEVDRLWNALTKEGQTQPCGWLKDKYGVSWQIVPAAFNDMAKDPDPKKVRNVMKAMFQMEKLDLEALTRAYEQD